MLASVAARNDGRERRYHCERSKAIQQTASFLDCFVGFASSRVTDVKNSPCGRDAAELFAVLPY
jgi:hypothetical protein